MYFIDLWFYNLALRENKRRNQLVNLKSVSFAWLYNRAWLNSARINVKNTDCLEHPIFSAFIDIVHILQTAAMLFSYGEANLHLLPRKIWYSPKDGGLLKLRMISANTQENMEQSVKYAMQCFFVTCFAVT